MFEGLQFQFKKYTTIKFRNRNQTIRIPNKGHNIKEKNSLLI